MTERVLAGRYRLVSVLGRGGMGEVWLADDLLLARRVALKQLPSRGVDPIDMERMLREARTAARLNHPHAVAVYDLVMEDGRPHVVFEYVPGTSLADTAHLAPRQVAEIGAAVADALAEAHAQGIVHRDVKPANILISDRGVPKLADFGIARAVTEANLTASGMFVGTPAYTAPEAATGAGTDGRSDIWSLGMTLYAALDGHPAFEHENALTILHRVVTQPVPRPVHGGPVADAVLRMLDKDPARRPTASEAAAMLRSAAVPETVRVPAPPPMPTFVRTRARRGRVLAAVFATLVLVAGAVTGAVLLGSGGNSPGAGSPPPSTTSTTQSSSLSVGPPSPSLAAYHAPGGLTCKAVRGWHEDTAAGTPTVRDFVQPGGSLHGNDSFFRIGISNAHPKPTFAAEKQGSVAFLVGQRSAQGRPYHGVRIVHVSDIANFLGTQAVDIEYTGANSADDLRHVKERLWIAGGATLIIEINSREADWSTLLPVFGQLVGGCRVG